MKKITYKLVAVSALVLGLSACQKKFDPSSYAPPLSIGGFTSTKEIAPSNLVAYYAFNGSAIDSVSNTAGTATGIGYSAGIKGQAMQGALNGYIVGTPPTSVAGLTSFTVTEWFKTPAPSTGIIGLFSLANTTNFWGNIEFFIENGSTNDAGKLRIHVFNGTDDRTLEINNAVNLFDKWNSMAVTYNQENSTVSVYLNGSLLKAGTLGGLAGPLALKNVGKFVFGTVQFMTSPSQTSSHNSEPWASFLTGQLDEVRVYNKALTIDEISALVKLEGRGK
ncbi:LamG domain-containing protein [Mucilaginibacter sp. ZT4R22]|uniref:LamG domain-containing protein n=1 Tax=Mucilaginibacter pankratovii TaxID=2772110 RepID=A0ABR7WR66_9SPHI|nr:LamG domain-containing protein [Mucilaginibacter pankratovii]MBD1364808.1 LamG domain-containing protein [Mucilaginibacter pankratovii]